MKKKTYKLWVAREKRGGLFCIKPSLYLIAILAFGLQNQIVWA